MSWKDRLRTLRYTPPSGGDAFTLLFDDISREVGKKAPVTEFPGQDRGAVQDLGQSTARYPVTCYFAGPDYDRDADRFFAALNESGAGRLEHPRYGDLTVIPTSVSQSESFVDGAGRATFEIDFVQADDAQFEYPRRVRRSPDAVSSATDAAGEAAAGSLGGVTVTDPGALERIRSGIRDTVDAVTGPLNTITDVADDVRASVGQAARDILNTVDDLAEAPAAFIESALRLYRLPARTITGVKSKISAYEQVFRGLADSFVDQTQEYGELFGLIRGANTAAVQAASAEATADGFISTRDQAQQIVDTLTGIQMAADDIHEAAGSPYEMRAAARGAVTTALRSLQERALNLPIEQSMETTREEPVIPLVYELYSDITDLDGTIDEFIRYNDLQGDEILLIPAGRTVRWYE